MWTFLGGVKKKVFILNIIEELVVANRVVGRGTMKQLADSLEMKVVAKGIENEYPHGGLEFFGCEFGQGYLFGVPQPEAMILDGHRSKNSRALTALAEALSDLPSFGCPR